mgnify:CR=1 FL=1
MLQRLTIALIVCASLHLAAVAADPTPADGLDFADVARWEFDTVRLADGRVLEGLIRSEDRGFVHFWRIERPPGEPLHVVGMRVAAEEVERVQRLASAQRLELSSRLRAHLVRARIEAQRADAVVLDARSVDGEIVHEYRGPWFLLRSAAGEEVTRQTVVRLEQIFAAFTQVLPPRQVPEDLPQIDLFASAEQYREQLQNIGIEVDHPALFLAQRQTVLAVSDLGRYADEVAEVRRHHQALEEQYDDLVATLPARLREEDRRLEQQGVPAKERRRITQLTRRKLQAQVETLEEELAASKRRNEARFDELTRASYARLYHEAWHAYLESFVYPQARYDVPRWLNEGLAQIFETAQFDAGTLRIDAPDHERLAQLQADLSSASPLALANVVAANDARFLVGKGQSREASGRHYLYAWGLTYHLAFERVIGTLALDEYLRATNKDSPVVARFERFVGQPLPEFESQWRAAMLSLGKGGEGAGNP